MASVVININNFDSINITNENKTQSEASGFENKTIHDYVITEPIKCDTT
jgi:hypothetical protein